MTDSNDTSTKWTSRKRLLTALKCGIPDRVPINTYELAGFDSKDWYNNQPSYKRLMDRVRADTDCITNWNPPARQPQGDEVSESGTNYLEHCLAETAYQIPTERHIEDNGGRQRTTETVHTPKGELTRVLEVDDKIYTTWQVDHWCKCKEDVDKVLSIPYEPLEYDATDLVRVKDELGDRGLVMVSLSDPAYIVADLIKMQDFTMWAFEDTEHFAYAVDVIAERALENLRRQLDACVVDFYRICGPEYFTPPYLPPPFFERFVVPHVKRMTDLIHERGSLVRLHCHGNLAQVLDMIIETGCDGIDPCEEPPDGDIALGQVKQRCHAAGVSICGTIQLQLLETGTADDIRNWVQHCMDEAKEGGGYTLLPCAAPISIDLSPKTEANYMTMIDAALELGRY